MEQGKGAGVAGGSPRRTSSLDIGKSRPLGRRKGLEGAE